MPASMLQMHHPSFSNMVCRVPHIDYRIYLSHQTHQSFSSLSPLWGRKKKTWQDTDLIVLNTTVATLPENLQCTLPCPTATSSTFLTGIDTSAGRQEIWTKFLLQKVSQSSKVVLTSCHSSECQHPCCVPVSDAKSVVHVATQRTCSCWLRPHKSKVWAEAFLQAYLKGTHKRNKGKLPCCWFVCWFFQEKKTCHAMPLVDHPKCQERWTPSSAFISLKKKHPESSYIFKTPQPHPDPIPWSVPWFISRDPGQLANAQHSCTSWRLQHPQFPSCSNGFDKDPWPVVNTMSQREWKCSKFVSRVANLESNVRIARAMLITYNNIRCLRDFQNPPLWLLAQQTCTFAIYNYAISVGADWPHRTYIQATASSQVLLSCWSNSRTVHRPEQLQWLLPTLTWHSELRTKLSHLKWIHHVHSSTKIYNVIQYY